MNRPARAGDFFKVNAATVAGPLTHESFIAAAEKLNTIVGGLTFAFTAENHQAMSKIYLTKIAGSKVVEIQK